MRSLEYSAFNNYTLAKPVTRNSLVSPRQRFDK